jgi:hypothetical protein
VGATQRTPSNSSRFRDRDKTADATSDDRHYFVTTVIIHDILERLVGSFMVVLPEVMGVAQVEDLDLEPIILLQLMRLLPHLILLPLLQM